MSTTKIPPKKARKKYKRSPTPKQIKAAKLTAENLRNKGKTKSKGQILKEAGYSKRQCEKPKDVTESLGFKELLKKMLPDNEVVKLQKDLMYAARLDSRDVESNLNDKQIIDLVESVAGCKVKKILRPKNKGTATVYFWTPDNNTRKSALDMFYKLNNSYPKDKDDSDSNQAVKKYLDKLAKILP